MRQKISQIFSWNYRTAYNAPSSAQALAACKRIRERMRKSFESLNSNIKCTGINSDEMHQRAIADDIKAIGHYAQAALEPGSPQVGELAAALQALKSLDPDEPTMKRVIDACRECCDAVTATVNVWERKIRGDNAA